MAPFFSVIIPSFNRLDTLPRAIESVLSQSFKDFELIVVDDGSTDGTKEYLETLNEVLVFRQENAGVSSARNLGIANARGKWICFLDSDDEWLPRKLEKQFEVITSSPDLPLVHTEEIWIRNGVRVNQMKKHKKGDGDQFFASLKLCLISPSSVAIRKDILEEFSFFDEKLPCCEDYDLWLKITHKYEVGFIESPLIKKYGGHEDQLSRKYLAMDYFRVKSMDNLFNNYNLNGRQKEALIKVLLKKCNILLKGYIKHDNLKNYDEIKNISMKYQNS